MPPADLPIKTVAPYLLSPFQLGKLKLKSRVVLAPLTRGRAGKSRVPNELSRIYYEQRAGAGLIISEATAISEQGYGWYHAPGIYNDQQVEGWRRVTDAVHAKGGIIFLQLWHMGRQAHSSYMPQHELPVSASAIPVGSGHCTGADGKHHDYEVPRPLELHELPGVVEDYRGAAARAKDAGFDGVEIHGANGYLLDQFLQTCSNQRTDEYGGSKENRFRLLREVVEAVKSVWEDDRIGVRLSPNGVYGGMGSEDNYELFPWVARKLKGLGIGYVHLMDGLGFGFHGKCKAVTLYDIKKEFEGPLMGNIDYTRDTADGAIRTGTVDLIAFGRPFISNPDLPHRFANNLPLAPEPHHSTYYKGEEKGYIDWPTYEEEHGGGSNHPQPPN